MSPASAKAGQADANMKTFGRASLQIIGSSSVIPTLSDTLISATPKVGSYSLEIGAIVFPLKLETPTTALECVKDINEEYEKSGEA